MIIRGITVYWVSRLWVWKNLVQKYITMQVHFAEFFSCFHVAFQWTYCNRLDTDLREFRSMLGDFVSSGGTHAINDLLSGFKVNIYSIDFFCLQFAERLLGLGVNKVCVLYNGIDSVRNSSAMVVPSLWSHFDTSTGDAENYGTSHWQVARNHIEVVIHDCICLAMRLFNVLPTIWYLF